MTTVCLTIVGLGPRGLSLLERIVERLNAEPLPATARLQIDIAEPGECGQGAHPSFQPDHLLVNTVASQIGIFGADSVVGGVSSLSLTQWARLSGYRRCSRRFERCDDGVAISDHDHLPRSLLGEYLDWAYARVIDHLPATVQVNHHRQRVVDLEPSTGGGFGVHLANGACHRADYVVLATGHGRRRPDARDTVLQQFARDYHAHNPCLDYLPSAYPIAQFERLPEQATVAVQGMGLTAYDVISALTLGRGGQFIEDAGITRYQRSGKEPRLLIFSRQCLPFAARGLNQKGIAGRHQARFFTVDAVRALRQAACDRGGDAQLDFVVQLLPLIEKEMAYAWRLAATGQDGSRSKEMDHAGFAASAIERAAVSRLLRPLDGLQFSSLEHYAAFFCNELHADLRQAAAGNLVSPLKAAADVLRDTRDALREAVEFCGLTPASHRYFIDEFVASTNRITFGPPRQRNTELLALMDAGVLTLGGGPGNNLYTDTQRSQFVISNWWAGKETRQYADVLVIARLDAFSPLTDSAPLTQRLVQRGLVQPCRNGDFHPGGYAINRMMQLLDRSGQAQPRLWAIGFVVEGPHFYTHALPRPMMHSRFTQDAELCASELLSAVSRQLQNQ
ncbi:MAG: FAD/NAD(P)-binding protein [Duganella sp.]